MYFRGLRRDGRKVILRFTGDAHRYLNNTAAIQELVKGAFEATIRLHTNKSTTVYYEIDGQNRRGMGCVTNLDESVSS